VIECNEAYTSKTCSYCGKMHKIGSKKTMKCDCGAKVVSRNVTDTKFLVAHKWKQFDKECESHV